MLAFFLALGWPWLEASTFIVLRKGISKAVTEIDGTTLVVKDWILGDECPVGTVLHVASFKCGILLVGEGPPLFGFALFKDAFALGVFSADGFTEMGLGIRIHFMVSVREVGAEAVLEVTGRAIDKVSAELWVGKDLLPVSNAVLVAAINKRLGLFLGPLVLVSARPLGWATRERGSGIGCRRGSQSGGCLFSCWV